MLRVIRALAIYRPSIIALQTPMTDEDFVFMEKCLQRSVVVSMRNPFLIIALTTNTGAGQADSLQWDSDGRVATYWRDSALRRGVLSLD